MTKSAITGPSIIYGDRNPPGAGGSNNPDKAPSLVWGGWSLFDHRSGYNITRAGAIGIYGTTQAPILDVVPSTLSATNIAAAQSVVAGTAMTLATASTGVTVLAAALQVWASGNSVPVGALVLDSNPALLSYGSPASLSTGNTIVSLYDPTKALSRNVRVTTNADDTAGTYVVAGYDIYGYPMSETITGVNNAVASGKKAFKFITSVTPAGTLNSTSVSVGTGDVFGLPMRADTVGYLTVWWNSTFATALATPFGTASAFTFADATTPATKTTGDVRGTVYVGTANPSNATRRLQVYATLSPNNISSGNTTAMFGVTQA